MIYLWAKVIHVLAIVAWMAGLLYLPRLFVYHSDKTVGSEVDAVFKAMERRLLVVIMRPAACAALASGVALLWASSQSLATPWLVMKLAAVLVLAGFHGYLEHQTARFFCGERPHGPRYYRAINEIPTLLLIVIVITVVVRPFS